MLGFCEDNKIVIYDKTHNLTSHIARGVWQSSDLGHLTKDGKTFISVREYGKVLGDKERVLDLVYLDFHSEAAREISAFLPRDLSLLSAAFLDQMQIFPDCCELPFSGSAVAFDGNRYLYACGGLEGKFTVRSEIFRWDLRTPFAKPERFADLQVPRHGAQAFVANDMLVVGAGHSKPKHDALSVESLFVGPIDSEERRLKCNLKFPACFSPGWSQIALDCTTGSMLLEDTWRHVFWRSRSIFGPWTEMFSSQSYVGTFDHIVHYKANEVGVWTTIPHRKLTFKKLATDVEDH